MNKNVKAAKEVYTKNPKVFWLMVSVLIVKNIILFALILHLISESMLDNHWGWGTVGMAYCLNTLGNFSRDCDDLEQITRGEIG